MGWLLLVLLSAAPSRADYERAREVAVQLEQEQAWDAAIRQWTVVRLLAPPDEAQTSGRRICFLRERLLGPDDARACYEELDDPASRLRAIALMNEAEQPAQLISLITTSPESEAARQALVRLLAMAPDPERALFEIAARVKPSPAPQDWPKSVRTLVANVWVEAAKLALKRDDARRALDILNGAEPVTNDTTWQDDALYLHAQAAERAGENEQALSDYTALIDRRERSFFIGSYDSEFYDDAFYEKARLLWQLGRKEEAHDVVKEMKKKTPTSRLLDDAEKLVGAKP